MSTNFKNQMKEVMSMAWRFFKVTGESFSECLKRAWQVYRLARDEEKNGSILLSKGEW